MGTQTERLQREIKRLIKQLGWSQKRFARELLAMTDEGDCATEDEVGQYEERVKKHLSRSATKPELLQRYLHQLQQHDAFDNLKVVGKRLANSPCVSVSQAARVAVSHAERLPCITS